MQTHSFPENSQLIIRSIDHDNGYDFSKVHRHEYYEIFLFTSEAGGNQLIDFEKFPVKKNGLYIVCPNQIHFLKREKGEDGFVMQFTKEYLLTTTNKLSAEWVITLRKTPFILFSDEQTKELKANIEELARLNSKEQPFKKQLVQNYFAYTIFKILSIIDSDENVKTKYSLVIDFLSLAENNFSTQRQINFYAQKLNVSSNTLRRQVKTSLGKSPLEVLHDILLLEIKRLMIVDQHSHKEVSFALNFDSQSSYNKFILKHTKQSPTAFKKALIEIHNL